jgi:peptidoglycan/LPS O-acetylase OafA/YrhL
MNTSPQELRRKLNRVATVVGLVSFPYWLVCVLLLDALSSNVSLTELHPVVAFLVIFAGVFVLMFPAWWVSDLMRKRLSLVCGTCGAWLSFRNKLQGECHRGHAQQSKDVA